MIFSRFAMTHNPEHTAAHELGHVFGLLHEHQRPDRDSWVGYNCRNVVGYRDAVARARAGGYTEDELCNRPGVAQYYGWGGSEFVKLPATDSEILTPYDFFSIMHYDSRHGADDAIFASDPTNALLYPMYGYNEAGDEAHFLPLHGGLPYPHFTISAGDAITIRAIYPFYPES